MNCWRCREKVGGPVCASCGVIQPPPVAPDYFAVLGLERRWTLPKADLDSAWRARSRLVHPDRFAGKPAVERRMSLQWTATINSARRALKDPPARGWYLATGSDRPPDMGGTVDPAFLETIFELQMEADDDPAGVAARTSVLREQTVADLEARLGAWESGDRTQPPDGVAELLHRMKYLDNLVTGH